MKPRKLPSGAWNVRITVNKQTYSFTDYDKKTVMKQAAAFADECRENVANPPLCMCLERFIEEHAESLSPSTQRGYGAIVRTIRKRSPVIGNKRIVTLTNRDIQTVIAPLKTPKTQRNYVHFIQVATGRTFHVKYKNQLPKEMAIPTDLEVLGLIELFRDTEMEIPIMLGAYGGLRRGEISALTMDDLDGDYLTISKDMVLSDDHEWITKPPKTLTSNRRILLPHFVAEQIRERGYITKLKPNSISNQLRKVQKRLKIEPEYCFHSLRHYCASYLHSQGIPDAYILQRGGWSSPHIMQTVYRHALSDKVSDMEQKAVNSFQFPFQS